MTTLGYTLSGCANGHPVRIDGTGSATPKELRARFAVAEAPVTFGAGLAHFAGLDAVMAVFAGLVQAPDEPLVARCRTDLLGEGGADLGGGESWPCRPLRAWRTRR